VFFYWLRFLIDTLPYLSSFLPGVVSSNVVALCTVLNTSRLASDFDSSSLHRFHRTLSALQTLRHMIEYCYAGGVMSSRRVESEGKRRETPEGENSGMIGSTARPGMEGFQAHPRDGSFGFHAFGDFISNVFLSTVSMSIEREAKSPRALAKDEIARKLRLLLFSLLSAWPWRDVSSGKVKAGVIYRSKHIVHLASDDVAAVGGGEGSTSEIPYAPSISSVYGAGGKLHSDLLLQQVEDVRREVTQIACCLYQNRPLVFIQILVELWQAHFSVLPVEEQCNGLQGSHPVLDMIVDLLHAVSCHLAEENSDRSGADEADYVLLSTLGDMLRESLESRERMNEDANRRITKFDKLSAPLPQSKETVRPCGSTELVDEGALLELILEFVRTSPLLCPSANARPFLASWPFISTIVRLCLRNCRPSAPAPNSGVPKPLLTLDGTRRPLRVSVAIRLLSGYLGRVAPDQTTIHGLSSLMGGGTSSVAFLVATRELQDLTQKMLECCGPLFSARRCVFTPRSSRRPLSGESEVQWVDRIALATAAGEQSLRPVPPSKVPPELLMTVIDSTSVLLGSLRQMGGRLMAFVFEEGRAKASGTLHKLMPHMMPFLQPPSPHVGPSRGRESRVYQSTRFPCESDTERPVSDRMRGTEQLPVGSEGATGTEYRQTHPASPSQQDALLVTDVSSEVEKQPQVSCYEEDTIAFFASLCDYPTTVEAWQRSMMEIFLQPQFFYVARQPAAMVDWLKVTDQLFTRDRTIFLELCRRRIQTSATFSLSKRKQSRFQRGQLLRRLSFVLFAGKLDQYVSRLALIQEKIVETFKVDKDPCTLLETFLLLRVLLCRISPARLRSFWPTILCELLELLDGNIGDGSGPETEVGSIFSLPFGTRRPSVIEENTGSLLDGRHATLGEETAVEEAGSSVLQIHHGRYEAWRFVDTAILLSGEHFVFYEWMFVPSLHVMQRECELEQDGGGASDLAGDEYRIVNDTVLSTSNFHFSPLLLQNEWMDVFAQQMERDMYDTGPPTTTTSPGKEHGAAAPLRPLFPPLLWDMDESDVKLAIQDFLRLTIKQDRSCSGATVDVAFIEESIIAELAEPMPLLLNMCYWADTSFLTKAMSAPQSILQSVVRPS